MTISQELTKLQTNLANSYTAVDNKGGTLPAIQNFDNLPSAIDSIQTGITPTGTINITQNGTYDVTNYASANVSVSGADKFKYGATIDDMLLDLNTDGTFKQPTENNHIISFDGLKTINNQYELAFKLSRSGAKKVSFPDLTTFSNSFTLSGLCWNNKIIEEIEFPELKTIPAIGFYTFQYALENTNIKKVSFSNLETIEASYAFQRFLQNVQTLQSVDFSKLKSITGFYAMQQLFSGCISQQLREYEFPSLEYVAGNYIFQQSFLNNQPSLKKVSFPKLTSINNGYYTFYQAFNSSTSPNLRVCFPVLRIVGDNSSTATYGTFCSIFGGSTATAYRMPYCSFPSLESIKNTATSTSYATFYNCICVERFFFPRFNSLVGNGQNTLFNNCNNLTEIHFGKANQAAIQAMSGYSTLWGRGAGAATVYFDLINDITVNGVVYSRDGRYYDYDNGYYSWTDSNENTIYTYGTGVNHGEYENQDVGDTVYTKSGDTYTASGTISAVA